MRLFTVNGLLVLFALAACQSISIGSKPQNGSPESKIGLTAEESPKSPEPALPATLMLANYPLSPSDRPTTDAAAAIAHLEGRLSEAGAASPSALVRAGLLYQRYQILGRIADLDQAFSSAKQLASAADAGDDAQLLWATLAAYMHEFEAAERALDRLPAASSAKAALLAQIKTARGQAERAPVFESQLAAGAEFNDLVQRAGYCVDSGDLDCATQHYHRAQFVYHDTAAFPLAWLHTQQGIALLRFGHPDWALRFFDAALARMPGYFLAAEHRAECLARTGKPALAREEYLKIIDQTGGANAGNPEFMAALAEVEGALGNAAEQRRWEQLARQGYATRLKHYPNAYAQHAVEFYMQINDLITAERLARQNLQVRQDVGSYVLLAEVALEKADQAQFCDAYQNAIKTGLMPPELSALRVQALACNKH